MSGDHHRQSAGPDAPAAESHVPSMKPRLMLELSARRFHPRPCRRQTMVSSGQSSHVKPPASGCANTCVPDLCAILRFLSGVPAHLAEKRWEHGVSCVRLQAVPTLRH